MADPDRLEEICLGQRDIPKRSYKMKMMSFYGKPWLNWLRNVKQKSNPTMNYNLPRVPDDEFEKMSHEAYKRLIVKWRGCFNCPLHCAHIVMAREGPYAGTFGEGFEYNQLIDAQYMGIFDINFVVKWTVETNRLGLDCDGPAFSIAWAMDLYERGIITKEDTGGIELRWGDQEVALELLYKIANREGFGDLLAEGPLYAAKKLGRGSEKYVYHIKGARLWIDPRTGWATALSHATSTRGADHLKGMPLSNAFGVWKGVPYDYTDDSSLEYKAEAVIFFEHLNAVIDSMGLCKNDTWSQCEDCPGLPEFAEMLKAATGVDFTPEGLLTIGERIYNVERAFNSRCGLTREHDTPPEKFFKEPIESKIRVLDREKFERLKDEYYRLRGWDVETGHPTRKKLEELGLKDVADDLERRGIIKPSS